MFTHFYKLVLGNQALLQLMCDELNLLWEHGIIVKIVNRRVAIVSGIWD